MVSIELCGSCPACIALLHCCLSSRGKVARSGSLFHCIHTMLFSPHPKPQKCWCGNTKYVGSLIYPKSQETVAVQNLKCVDIETRNVISPPILRQLLRREDGEKPVAGAGPGPQSESEGWVTENSRFTHT